MKRTKFLAMVLVAVLLIVVASAAGAQQPQQAANGGCTTGTTYDPACDVNRDGDTDVQDITLVAGHWNQTGVWSSTGDFWSILGNAGTDPSTNFLGTTGNQVLEVRVNNERALRIEPASDAALGFRPNVIGGHSLNEVTGAGVGATIAGGGAFDDGQGNVTPNRVTDDYGTVSGGQGNQAGRWGAVGGGQNNTASGTTATIGGGSRNTASTQASTVAGGDQNTASGFVATIGGGGNNTAAGNRATIAGGSSNTVEATSDHGTIAGGWSNTASGDDTVVAGGESNSAGGTYASVSGGKTNAANGYGAAVAGGTDNTVDGGGQYGTIGGGASHTVSGQSATVGGGFDNEASGNFNTIAGGTGNTTNLIASTVGGGQDNTADGWYATVPGGAFNTAQGSGTFAAGYRAKANHMGAFVWADHSATEADFASTGTNQFLIRAAGGVGIGTNSPAGALHLNTATGEPPSGLPASNNGLVLGLESLAGYKWIQSYGGKLALNPEGNNVGIGTTDPTSKLEVAGGDIRVTDGSFIDDGTTLDTPDYVFEDGYPLMSLADLQTYIAREKHLPNVPSAEEIKRGGLNLSQFQMRLLEKVEELTLYVLAQQAEIEAQNERITTLEQQVVELEARLETPAPER